MERKKIAEGKTKRIWGIVGDANRVIVENKKAITAFDDPKYTKEFETKAVYATETTCQVFELLKKAGIPVAYQEQISPTEFVADKCLMISLEVVGRRCAVGSYLKRHPELTMAADQPPYRFHRLRVEFFLKTTQGKLLGCDGEVLVEGLDAQKGEEDPLIANPYGDTWELFHSKKPAWDPAAQLGKRVWAQDVLSGVLGGVTAMQFTESCLRSSFLVLEGAWAMLGCRLIDMKVEFGLTAGNEIVIADVIDNDSWRLRNFLWKELSKEAFRQGEALDEVERKYGLVASLVKGFRIPHQCLVLWRGSEKDSFPELNPDLNLEGLTVERVTISGHKSPRQCIEKLEDILRGYPDGGVIVVKVGMSNGLGPMLAARTSWPVIAIPATLKEFPQDLWSSTRMPSSVPLAVVCSDSNAIGCALSILAQKNPILYQQQQGEVEGLDE